MRKRFKTNRICSSEDYTTSKRVARLYQVETEVIVTPKLYVRCFGRLIEISREEALRLKDHVEIIFK